MSRVSKRIVSASAIFLALCLVSGCVGKIADAIATAPNHGKSVEKLRLKRSGERTRRTVTDAFRVQIDQPRASISVWIVDPPEADGVRAKPKGTILFLHGIFGNKEMLLETARSFAAVGYRGVLIDSRGHGESSGDWLGYGALESRDYSTVLDELAKRDLLAGRIGVYGCSYGAGVAVQFGARDRRVAAVVALSPFSSMRAVVHDRARALGLRLFMTEERVNTAIDLAAERGGFKANDANGVAALRNRRIPLLIIHGKEDRTIPFSHAERLMRVAGEGARLVPIENATHDDWTEDGLGRLWPESREWFDRWLTGNEQQAAASVSVPSPSPS